MNTIKYSNAAKCPKCGGLLAYDARMTDRLPTGFGFTSNGKFVVDTIERKGWRGECMECQAQVFAVVSQRHVRKLPRSINAKIDQAQATLAQPQTPA